MLLESPRIEAELLLDEKIGEGQHREVFRSGPFAVKVLKPYRVKRRWLRTARLPLQNYVESRYGIKDFNQHELENYRLLAEFIPKSLRDFFTPIHWAGLYKGRSASLSDLAINDDGSLAQSLTKTGVILDDKFWNALDVVENLLLERKMFFIGVNSDNILVRTKDSTQQPVIVDYKWLGPEAYPCQFWLRWQHGLIRKLRRKFQSMRELYKPK